MLSWIFQAYADAFSVATFQAAQHPAPVFDEERSSRQERRIAPGWQRPAPASKGADRDRGRDSFRPAA